jgi:hypothetical protein
MVPKAFLYFIMVVALTHDNLTTPDIHKKTVITLHDSNVA